MLRNAVIATFTAALTTFAAVDTAHATHPCTSEYVKFRQFWDKFGGAIVLALCNWANTQDPAGAQQCLKTYNDAMAKANFYLNQHNQIVSDSQLTIGPRPLGEATWKTGKLQAQRTWVGVPVVSDTYRVQMERTGGKAKSTVSGTVCFLDDKGESKQTASFTVNPGSPTFDQVFSNVLGLSPVVLLSMPLSAFDAHQYKIMGTRGSAPAAMVPAIASTLKFSSAGPIGGAQCTKIDEGADLAGGWGDNYLCAQGDLGLKWSMAGPIAGMRCTQVLEPSEPASTTWTDNYLCVPSSSPLNLQWSYAGPVAGKSCVAWTEPGDPHTWSDNYLCW